MKALTLTQPWATLVALGLKTLETRSWTTDYRGPLAIHAAKGIGRNEREFCELAGIASMLRDAGIPDPQALPRGAVIAETELVEVRGVGQFNRSRMGAYNALFGDFSAGRFVWILGPVRKIEPVPARGALGLWDWTRPLGMLGDQP